MRTLVQPGPIHPNRIDSFTGDVQRLEFSVEPGVSLLAALTGPLAEAGFQAAVLRFSGALVDPFHYVMPALASDVSHVAYFSATHSPIGQSKIQRGNASFGFRLGQPFLHCHAAWIEPDGERRGGHILNEATILTSPIQVEGWGFRGLRLDVSEDRETNFSLFQPIGHSTTGAGAILARVRPNVDITLAVEQIAARHGVMDASIEGSVGSLVGTRFVDGRDIADHATEVLITDGVLLDGVAAIDVMSVDMSGRVHEGRLARGENPVCITFDLVMVPAHLHSGTANALPLV